MKRIGILISGRGSNMKAIVRNTQNGILRGWCEVAVVLSNVPGAAGLGVANDLGVPTVVVDSTSKKRRVFEREMIAVLEEYGIDYVVLAGFMRILSPQFIGYYRNRIINIHPADTNLFRGLGGYEWAYKQRLSTTKITVHCVDEGVDTGTVLAQRTVDLRGAETLEEVEKRGLAVEHTFYSDVLLRIMRGDITTGAMVEI
jgi:phosphoribosylglycinamide formyltransferase-1